MHLTIYCDGGAKPNPGKGYGSYEIRDESNKILHLKCTSFGDNPVTNNQAEYLILLDALAKASEYQPTTITAWTDSRLVVMQLIGRWACRDRKLKELRDQASDLMLKYGAAVKWNPRAVSVEKFGH